MNEKEIIETSKNLVNSRYEKLAEALAKAQGEMSVVNISKKDFYKDFEKVVKASRPNLSKHGLSISQSIKENENGESSLRTILLHASGQCLEGSILVGSIPEGGDVDYYITYLRMQSYINIAGIVINLEF